MDFRRVPSHTTATIKLELLPLSDGIITLDTLQIEVKEKGVCPPVPFLHLFLLWCGSKYLNKCQIEASWPKLITLPTLLSLHFMYGKKEVDSGIKCSFLRFDTNTYWEIILHWVFYFYSSSFERKKSVKTCGGLISEEDVRSSSTCELLDCACMLLFIVNEEQCYLLLMLAWGHSTLDLRLTVDWLVWTFGGKAQCEIMLMKLPAEIQVLRTFRNTLSR